METIDKGHMHFELATADKLEFASPYVRRWMELVQAKVETLPRGEPLQHAGSVCDQQVYATLVDDANRMVIGSQVTDDLRVLISLEASRHNQPRLHMKVTHYVPGRVRKPRRDPSERMVFTAHTLESGKSAGAERSLEMFADIAFETIRQKGFNDEIKALFRAPQPD